MCFCSALTVAVANILSLLLDFNDILVGKCYCLKSRGYNSLFFASNIKFGGEMGKFGLIVV